jgi:hypothetical protein
LPLSEKNTLKKNRVFVEFWQVQNLESKNETPSPLEVVLGPIFSGERAGQLFIFIRKAENFDILRLS